MIKEKIYFKNLDTIRFIAALMVYIGHGMKPALKLLAVEGTFWERIIAVISSGATGVSIFFVLSGFLITYLLMREHELNNRVSLKNFYIRRVLRIWPLYYLVVAFSFFIYPFLKSIIGIDSQLASNVNYYLTFLSNFDVIRIEKCCEGQDAMSQGITWSVAIEEQFYVFWPLIFVFLPKRFWGYCIGLVILGSVVFRLINHADKTILYYHTFSVLLDLGIGGFFAFCIRRFQKIKLFFERTGTLMHLLAFIVAFSFVCWDDIIFPSKYGLALGRIVISLSFAFIISAQAVTKNSSALNLGQFSFPSNWGKYTYGIYMLHPIAILVIDIIVRVSHLPNKNFISLFIIGLAGLILTLVISKLSYHIFESRFLKLKDKFTTLKTHE